LPAASRAKKLGSNVQRSESQGYEKSRHGRTLLVKCTASAAAGVGLHVDRTAHVYSPVAVVNSNLAAHLRAFV